VKENITVRQSPFTTIDLSGAAKVVCDELSQSPKKATNTTWNVRSPKLWLTVAGTVLTLVFAAGGAYSQLNDGAKQARQMDRQIQANEAAIVEAKSEQKVSNVKLGSLKETQDAMAKDVKEIRDDVSKIQQDIAAIKEAVKR
jgi:septal ring factor EnvC (AmiA/AmiB activator)